MNFRVLRPFALVACVAPCTALAGSADIALDAETIIPSQNARSIVRMGTPSFYREAEQTLSSGLLIPIVTSDNGEPEKRLAGLIEVNKLLDGASDTLVDGNLGSVASGGAAEAFRESGLEVVYREVAGDSEFSFSLVRSINGGKQQDVAPEESSDSRSLSVARKEVGRNGENAVSIYECYANDAAVPQEDGVFCQGLEALGAVLGVLFDGASINESGQVVPGRIGVSFHTPPADGDNRGPTSSNVEAVVVWTSSGSAGDDSSGTSIQGRFLSDQGPVESQFQVNTFTDFNQINAAAASNGSRFVVVWESEGSAGTDNLQTSVQARVYGPDGNPLGPDFQINQTVEGFQYQPDIAMRDDGSFVVVWTEINATFTQSIINMREFAADGSPLSDEIQVNTSPIFGTEPGPRIAMSGGDLAVVWLTPGGVVLRKTLQPIRIFQSNFEDKL